MIWFFSVVIVVVMGVVAVVAAGRGGELAPAESRPDRAGSALPAGVLTGDDVRRVRFGSALHGYHRGEVEAVLARLCEQLDQQPVSQQLDQQPVSQQLDQQPVSQQLDEPPVSQQLDPPPAGEVAGQP